MERKAALQWISDIEGIVNHKLAKWTKIPREEHDDHHDAIVQLAWRWKQVTIVLNISWKDGAESVHMVFTSPRTSHEYRWAPLDNKTFNRVMDRVGNLAQTAMHPPIEADY